MYEANEQPLEKPKISRPKPTIASKPKYIPPVNLKVTPKSDLRTTTNGKDAFLDQKARDHSNLFVKNIDYSDKCATERERTLAETVKFIPQHQSFKPSSHEVTVGTSDVRVRAKNGREHERTTKVSEIARNSGKLSCVAPNSPSTVCCSILSNSAGDCCGIMGHKKEMTSKSMTKIDSLDSNSSDSGGFKDFIQLESIKKLSFDAENGKFERKFEGHQRKFSQPEFLEKSVAERAKTLTQSFCERKSSESDDNRKTPKTEIGRLSKPNLVQNLAPNFTEKTDDIRSGIKKPPVCNPGQFKQSTKMLEDILTQRIEKEKQRQKKLNLSQSDNESGEHDFEQQMAVQKQIQQKLHADLKQTVKQIQEIQSIELKLPQNRSWDSNRSQPAIGLKHTPKSRYLFVSMVTLLASLDRVLAWRWRPRFGKFMDISGLWRPHSRSRWPWFGHNKQRISLQSAIWIDFNFFGLIARKYRLRSQNVSPTMDDPEIQETVESILGKEVKIVDCEKKSSIKEEEVLLINGLPVTLEGRDGRAIKQALLTGQVPPCDLLNTLLIRTGILKAPVKLETSLSVKTSTVTKEEVTVARDGKIVDERSRETKENNFYTSSTSEVWEPVKIIPNPELVNSKYSASKFSDISSHQNGYETGSERKFGSCSSASSYESDGPVFNGTRTCLSKDSGHLTNSSSGKVFTQSSADSLSSLDETDYKNDLVNKFRKSSLHSNGYKDYTAPTIFGTVASDLTPKDCSNRRSLPQTPQTSKNFSALYNGESGQGNDHIADSEIHQDNALVYRDGNLISGSLEALIQHMVPTDIYYPDRAYLFAFLLSSRLFIKPHELLSRVRQMCEAQQGLGTAGTQHGPATARFAEHLVQLLAEWTETFPYDFRDERVMQQARTITQQCMTLNQSLRSSIPVLLQNLQQRLKTLDAYEKSLDQTAPLDDSQPTDITEVCPNPSVLAQQLTHMELERLSFIGPEEFVQAFAKENPHIETSFKDMKKTRNLEQYVQWFNRLSYFVATQVCKHPKKKQRVRVVEFWIETARECFNIGNFNSLMAIIAGLNMSPISRLKKTWNKIQSGKFSILEHQMDPSSNFSSYRSTLKAAMWRSAGATDQRQRIVIPFFSLLVKDLYFLNEGCSNKLPNGHINFEKFWQLAKQVTEFMAWKQVACPFEKETKVISLLQRGAVLSENALALASFECEQPENNQERERCKSLKAENTA